MITAQNILPKPVKWHGHLCRFLVLWAGLNGIISGQTTGPNNQYAIVEDLSSKWQVYDPAYESYVPYVQELYTDYRSHSIFLDIQSNRYYWLLYKAEHPRYLFINNNLQRELPAKTWVVLSLDSLHQANKASPQVLLTFFGNTTGTEDQQIFVGHKRAVTQEKAQTTVQALPRSDGKSGNFLVISGLFLLVMFVFLRNNYPMPFGKYINLQGVLTLNPKDDTSSVVRSPLDLGNLLFLVLLGFVLSWIYVALKTMGVNLWVGEGVSRSNFLDFILMALLILGIFSAKYCLLLLMGSVYRLEAVINFHFFKVVQSSLVFFTVLGSLVLILVSQYPWIASEWRSYLFGAVILFYLVRFVLLFASLNQLPMGKNLYLFSYLCIVELIPLLVGIRFMA